VLAFGLFAAGLMLVLTNVVVPASRTQMAERQAEIGANVTARLLSDGRFMHPSDGMTFYIREIAETGELLDIFLADDRTADRRTTYSARRAFLVRGADAPKLVMFDGMTQTLDRATDRLAVTHFSDFTYDLSGLLTPAGRGAMSLGELSTAALLNPTDDLMAMIGEPREAFLTDGHKRLAQPFLALAASLVGFAALLMGGFSRFGLWRQIGLAIVLLLLIQMADNAALGASLRTPGLWPLAYAAPALGCAIAAGLLAWGQRPRRPREAAA
jgi:lipopolysaccharide export system permease protein